MNTAEFEIPGIFRDLAEPPRFLTYYGGRGSAKSWSIIAWIIARCWGGRERVVIAREILKSIKASSHQLCADMIERMGLSADFEVQRDQIICHRTGSTIIQSGLKSHIDSFKGLEGITILFVDESQSVSSESLEVITPTIRAPGSVIVFSMNPRAGNDPVYARYVLDPPPNAKAVRVNYVDNPHFPAELQAEMEHMQATDPDLYRHVWLGEPLTRTEAQVFAGKWSIEPFEATEAYGDPLYGVDFGFAKDPSVALRCFAVGRRLYVDFEAGGVGVEIDDLPDLFDAVPGIALYASRADNSRPETISFLNRHSMPRMESVDKWPGSIEDGIEFLRSFNEIVIHPRCEGLIEEMALYSYKVDRRTDDVLPEVLDAHNHYIDALRYALAPLIRPRSTRISTRFVTGLS